MNSIKPTLTLFCGLPGSGKTTLAKQLEKQSDGVRLCTDDWQFDLEMNHNPDNFHKKLQRRLYVHALELLQKNQSVIWEEGLWAKSERESKIADAKKYSATTEFHYFDLTFEELWERLNSRNQNLPHGAVHISKKDLLWCWDQFEKPTTEELAKFDKVFVYHGKSLHPTLYN